RALRLAHRLHQHTVALRRAGQAAGSHGDRLPPRAGEQEGRSTMTDRRPECLTVLVDQVNAIAPNRDVSSDGWIGDESHQTTTSDPNPWVYDDDGTWVVTAQDITDDPDNGMSCQQLVDAIVASEDERIKYIIWNCQ